MSDAQQSSVSVARLLVRLLRGQELSTDRVARDEGVSRRQARRYLSRLADEFPIERRKKSDTPFYRLNPEADLGVDPRFCDCSDG